MGSKELLGNPGFEAGTTTGWATQAAGMEITGQENACTGKYALKITNRTADYGTAFQNVANSLKEYGAGKYRISAQVKLTKALENGSVCKPMLVLKYRDGAGDHYAKTERIEINADTYTKLEAEVDVAWEGSLEYAQLYVQSGNGKECLADLYVDDFSLVSLSASVEEMLTNPGFETGDTTNWSKQYADIAIDTANPHTGSYALKITNRTQDWSTAVQNVASVLNACGPGKYKISAWVKLAGTLPEGSVCKPMLVIKYNNGKDVYAQTGRVAISADRYTKLEAEVDMTWSGMLASAQMYVQTGTGGKDCLADLYVDDFSLVNISKEEVNEPSVDNLAAGKTVTASSTQEGYNPAKIVDGNKATSGWQHWASDVSQGPQWIEIDFGKNVTFNRVEMYLHDNYTQKGYEVQYLDGGTWKNCFGKVTDNTEPHNTYTFKKVKTSKLRVYVTEGNVLQSGVGGGENVARISEVEVYYDQNLALGATVTASSTQEGYAPTVIVDGRGEQSTEGWKHWASDVSKGPQWIQMDFGKEISFKRVEVYFKAGYEQKSYEIQYWNGTDWVNCLPKIENNTEDYRIHNFDEVTSSKLRIYVTEGNVQQDGTGGGENVARIAQVEVYATNGIYIDRTEYPEAIPQSIENRSKDTTVGAIRWDVWGSTEKPLDEGSQTERVLSPNKYHFRLPWYAQVTGENSAHIPQYTQEIVDQEIHYAKEAGIDYWAFVMYRDRSAEGRQALDLARNLYLSSQYRNEVKWCAVLGASDFPASEYPWLVEQFKEENYQKVQNGRPLVYVYSTNAVIVSKLRSLCEERGITQPYVVVMGANAKTMKLMQADALSAYTSYGANGSPYSSVMATDQSNWNLWKSYGAQVVPIVSTGWDPRPRIDDPVTWTTYGSEQWAETATPKEIADNLNSAVEWNKNNQDASFANTVIMYAWNELDEGGWIMPTYGSDGKADTGRLDAIKQVLRPGSEEKPENPGEEDPKPEKPADPSKPEVPEKPDDHIDSPKTGDKDIRLAMAWTILLSMCILAVGRKRYQQNKRRESFE